MAEFVREKAIHSHLANNAVLLAWLHDLFEPPFGHGLDPLIRLGSYFGDILEKSRNWPVGGDFSLLLLKDFLNDRWVLWRFVEDVDKDIADDLEGLKRKIEQQLGTDRIKDIVRLLEGKDLNDEEMMVIAALNGNVIDVDRVDYLVRDRGMIESALEALGLRNKAMRLLLKIEGVENGAQAFRARNYKDAVRLKQALDYILWTRYQAYMDLYENPQSFAGDESVTHMVYALYTSIAPSLTSHAIREAQLETVLLAEDDMYHLLDMLGGNREYEVIRNLVYMIKDEHKVFSCLLEIGLPVSAFARKKEVEEMLSIDSPAGRFMELVKNRFCRAMDEKLALERDYAEELIRRIFRDKSYDDVYEEAFHSRSKESGEYMPLVFINLRDFYAGWRGLHRWIIRYKIKVKETEEEIEVAWKPPSWGFIRLHVFAPDKIYLRAKKELGGRFEVAARPLLELLTEGLKDRDQQTVFSYLFNKQTGRPWNFDRFSDRGLLHEDRPYVRWCDQLFFINRGRL